MAATIEFTWQDGRGRASSQANRRRSAGISRPSSVRFVMCYPYAPVAGSLQPML